MTFTLRLILLILTFPIGGTLTIVIYRVIKRSEQQ